MRRGSLGGEQRHRFSALIEFDSTTGRRRQGKRSAALIQEVKEGLFLLPIPMPPYTASQVTSASTPPPPQPHLLFTLRPSRDLSLAERNPAKGRWRRGTCLDGGMERWTYCCKLHRSPVEKLVNFIQFRHCAHTITHGMSLLVLLLCACACRCVRRPLRTLWKVPVSLFRSVSGSPSLRRPLDAANPSFNANDCHLESNASLMAAHCLINVKCCVKKNALPCCNSCF